MEYPLTTGSTSGSTYGFVTLAQALALAQGIIELFSIIVSFFFFLSHAF